MFKKRDRIVASIRKLQTKHLMRSHKFGIKCSRTVEQAYLLDVRNSNILWADALFKEMENVRVKFDILSDGSHYPLATNLCNAIWYLI